jgi:16S rRNA processing protein RimM
MDMLPKLEGNQFYYHEIIGFRVVDQRLDDIGTVHSIIENTAQPLFEIYKGDKQILIPMIDEFILQVNRTSKELHLNTPVGLVDLYLE